MEENTELEDDKLIETPSFGSIEELDVDTILSDDVFQNILSINNQVKKERQLAKIQLKAKELKVSRQFNNLFKQYKENFIKDMKSVNSNTTNFTDSPYKWIVNEKEITQLNCGGWIANDEGIYKIDYNSSSQPIKVKASSIPVMPIERLINIDTNIEKVKLAFFKDGKWKELIVEKNTISSKNKILQLANAGLEVTEDNAKNLIKYLADVIEFNTFVPKKGITHLGWANKDFVPYTKEYTYDGDMTYKNIFESVKENGQYAEWKDCIKELRAKSKTLRFLMATSFASPLIKIFNINPFIVHVWGKSSTGKTVAQMICASIWGNPAKGKLLSTLDSTKVASERLSNFLRNLPLILDELQIIRNKYKNLDDMIYGLTEGKGRNRGTSDGGMAENTEWDNIIILSGEEPITSDSSKEGAKNRVIEIEENNVIVEDGRQIVSVILENYGYAGKEFIEIMQKDEELFEQYNKLVEELKEKSKSPKQINALSAILFADNIVSEKIFNDKKLTIDDVDSFFTKDIDEADRYINLIIDIANANINNFYDSNNGYPPSGQVWGKLVKTTDGNGKIIYYDFIPTKLYQILEERNINWNGIKKKMADKGYLIVSSEGKYQIVARTQNGLQKMIRIKNIYFDTPATPDYT